MVTAYPYRRLLLYHASLRRHFALEPAPAADLDAQARAAYDRSYEGYRKAYAEQVALER